MLHGVEVAVNELDGCREVRNRILREAKLPKPCAFTLKAENLPERYENGDSFFVSKARYELTLDLRSDEERPKVKSEKLAATVTTASGDVEYRMVRDGLHVEISDPLAKSPGLEKAFELYPYDSGKLVAANGLSGLAAILFREYVSDWRFFNVTPGLARRSAKESAGSELSEHGENLAVVLHEIERSDPRQLLEICSWMRSAVPGFESVSPVKLSLEGGWAFQISEKRIKAGLNPQSVSDGTVRLLTLMVIAAWVSKKATLICIEEPENGVHPHLAESFVSALRAVSSERQFLVTTHSPSFLDYLEPAELLLVDKKTGLTEIRRAADTEDIAVFAKKFSLGDLWQQGLLEGIP
jgi:predicted ATPase